MNNLSNLAVLTGLFFSLSPAQSKGFCRSMASVLYHRRKLVIPDVCTLILDEHNKIQVIQDSKFESVAKASSENIRGLLDIKKEIDE